MKCFIIYLKNNKSSENTANTLYQQLKSFNHEVFLFEGTHLEEANIIFQQEKRLKHTICIYEQYSIEKFNFYKNYLEKSGVKGCFYSHYRLWQKCVDLNEEIMVFEDDVIIYRNYIPVKYYEILYVSFEIEMQNIFISSQLSELSQSQNELNDNFLISFEKPKAIDYLNDTKNKIGYASGYIIKPATAKNY